jgi:D-alanyl-lipoteichoic acid acyltransferase DltB (MBOAT superfamily)
MYKAFFPQLIAGPIVRYRDVATQIVHRVVTCAGFAYGVRRFAIGLGKKVLIANAVARCADAVFAIPAGEFTAPVVWFGFVCYSLQIYFDFSGYSDMAIGLSLMFNVRLPANFDSPYKAASIIDFWRRWHMTLSAFLRDYLYIPLGGNRKGPARRYVNLLATMVLGGLWHGAGWTFVAWGALHGLYLVANHGWRALLRRLGWRGAGAAGRIAGIAFTFLAVVVGWVVFRAESLDSAGRILAGMAGLNGISFPAVSPQALHDLAGRLPAGSVVFAGLAPLTYSDGRAAIAAIVAGLAAVWLLPNVREVFARYAPVWDDAASPASLRQARPRFLEWSPRTSYAVALGALFCACLLWMGASRTAEFLYFQF